MFGTIRKHQTWLWAVIITLTIISFVWFFGPTSKVNSERRREFNAGSINGERITQDDYINARNEVHLQYFFFRSAGSWPTDDAKRMGWDEEREIYQLLLLIQKQRQMGIQISAQMAGQTARNLLSQLSQNKQEISPTLFVERILRPHGLDYDDFDRFLRHSLGTQELISTMGVTGKLIPPQEAKDVYISEHQELATEAVFFEATNYLSGIAVTPQALTNYYLGETNKYEIPERVQVSYVRFDYSNYAAQAQPELAKMTNLDQQIDAAYKQNSTNLLRELKVKTLEEAKAKIREQELKKLELPTARQKAAEFARILFDATAMRAEYLDLLARSNGLTVKITAPFDRDLGPKDISVGDDFAKESFKLTPTEPFAPTLVGEDGVYVIAYHKQIPAEVPPLDQIRDKLTADYKQSQALTKARVEGTMFSMKLTTNLTQGKTFEAVCAEAKLKPESLPPFSLSTRTVPEIDQHVPLDRIKQVAFSTVPGKVSTFQASSDGGYILYVKSKLPVDPVKMNSELAAFTQNLRLTRQHEAFNLWFSREAERGLRDTPLAQRDRKQQNATMQQRKS
jgi:hypothetical protein